MQRRGRGEDQEEETIVQGVQRAAVPSSGILFLFYIVLTFIYN